MGGNSVLLSVDAKSNFFQVNSRLCAFASSYLMELRNIADKDVSFANIILSLFLNGILLITRVLVQNSAMCLISLSWQMMTLSFYSRTRIQSVPQHKKASDFNSAEQLYHEQCHTFVLFLSYI